MFGLRQADSIPMRTELRLLHLCRSHTIPVAQACTMPGLVSM